MPRGNRYDPYAAAREKREQDKFQMDQQREQRQEQQSAYAASRFAEWERNANLREQTLQAREASAQSNAEVAGLATKYNLWRGEEVKRQTAAYYEAMPVLQQQLKQAGINPGTERYAAEMAAFAGQIPEAVVHVQSIREDLKNYSKVDETSAQIADRIKTFQEGMRQAGETPGAVHLSKEGIISGEGSSKIPEPVLMRYGKLVGDIEEYAASDKARVSAAQKEKSIFETKYPELSTLLPATPTPTLTPTPAGSNLNLLQRGLIATGLGKAPETQATPTPAATPPPAEATAQPQSTPTHLGRYNPATGAFE